MPRNFSNTASAATLAGGLSTSTLEILLDSFSGFPAAPFTATIDRGTATEEIVLVTDVAGSTVTMTRGYDGTTAQAHSAGASFEHTAIAKDFRDASAHIDGATGVHGAAGAVVGTTDAQTLSNKTVLALLAQATAGAPAITTDSASGVTSKLLSLKQAGVERAFVDYLGNLTAKAVTGTTGTFSGALSATASTLASLGVTGATTLTGALAANGGLTVPAGKKATLTDAPTAGTDGVNKTYADALGVAAATASTIVRRDASGKIAAAGVTGLAAPTAGGDAVNKTYADDRANAGQWVHVQNAGTYSQSLTTTSATLTGTAGSVTVPTGRNLDLEYSAPRVQLFTGTTVYVRLTATVGGVVTHLDGAEIFNGSNDSNLTEPVRLSGTVVGTGAAVDFKVEAWYSGGGGANVTDSAGSTGPKLRRRIS